MNISNRRRSMSLAEVIGATSLAAILISVHASELNRQRVDLQLVAHESRARDELLTAYERLRAGTLSPPVAVGTITPVETSKDVAVKGLTVTVERLPQSAAPSRQVVPVRLRAAWRSLGGHAQTRELTTLIAAGGSE